MVVKSVKIKDIIPYENNPRKNDEAVAFVAESIKRFGFRVPLVLDKDNVIVCGHTRLKAAKKLSMRSVPCIYADDLSEEQISAFRLADNKVAELAEWDVEKLNIEIEALKQLDVDLSTLGFEVDEPSELDELTSDDAESDNALTLQLTLCEEQYQICEGVIDFWWDNISHNFGNKNKRSNALFEAVYAFAKNENLIKE